MFHLINTNGKLVGLWFDIPLTDDLVKRPFGGNKALYLSYLEPYFKVKTFERCYNSITNRKELFGVFIKH
jgi:thiopurine S-methyltransferase